MNRLFKTFSVVFVLLIIVKLVDVFRNLYIASIFGVSNEADIYLGIITIPDSLLIITGLDSLRGVINSEFSKYNALGKIEEIFLSYKNLLLIVLLISLVLLLPAFYYNNELLSIMLPGFSGEKKYLASSILKIILPLFILKSLLNVLTPLYNSFKKYNLVSFSPVIISIVIIIFLNIPLIQNSYLNNLSYANLLGNSILFFFLLAFSFQLSTKGKMKFVFFDSLTKTILRNCASIFVLVFVNQVYLSSRNYFVSYYGDGAISSLNYASSIPIFISTFTFTLVFGILLSELSAGKHDSKRSENKKKYFDTFLNLIFIFAPLILWLVVFEKEILNLLYLRGNFDTNGISSTLLPFTWEVLNLFSFLLYTIPTALYLANKKYYLLSKIGITVYVLGIPLNYFMCQLLGFYGVSVSGFIVSFVNGALLIYFSQSLLGSMKPLLNQIGKIVLSAVLVYVVAIIMKKLFFAQTFEFTFYSAILNTILGFLMISFLYIVVTTLIKLDYSKKIYDQIKFIGR